MFQTEYLHLSVFNMITGLRESKILTIHISCECKCKFDGKKGNSNKCWCECKNPKWHKTRKQEFGILLHVVVKMLNI